LEWKSNGNDVILSVGVVVCVCVFVFVSIVFCIVINFACFLAVAVVNVLFLEQEFLTSFNKLEQTSWLSLKETI